MVWYTILIITFIAFVAWFVRTPLFRAHRNGRGRDPGEQGTRMDGKYPTTGGSFNRPEKRP
jgi:hypothetical protein